MPWPANATKSEEDSSSVGRNTEKGSESTGTAAGSQHEQILPTLVRSLAIHQIPDSAESSADRKIEEATKTGKPVTAGQQQEARFHSIIFNKGEENLAMRGIQKTKCAIIQTTKTLKEAAFNQQKALSPVHLFTQSIEDTNENLDFRKANYSLTSLRFWDIQVHPVKQRMVAGHLVPTAKSVMSPFMSKQRRISLEYHEPEETSIKRRGSGATKLADYREQNDQKRASLFQQASQEQNRTTNLIDKASLGDKDRFYFIILKHMDDSPQGAAGNDLSTSDGWHIRYEVPFQELELVHSWDRSIELRVGQDTDTKVRIFQFSCQEDTSAFLNLYHHVKQLYQERTKRLANAYTDKVKSHLTPTKTKPTISQRSVLESVNQYELKESDLQPKWKTNLQKIGFSPLLLLSRPKPKKETTTEDSVKLLVEIVSASLPDVLDLPNIGPFVKVTDGNNVVHTTKVIPKTSDPVWTLRTGSFFLIQSSAEQFFETNFIKFHVQLNDRVGTKARTKFGVVNVSKDELLNGKGDRIQYEIMPEVKKTHGVSKYFMMNLVTGRLASRNEGKKKYFLALRYRQATKEDISFMSRFDHDQSLNTKNGVYAADSLVPPKYQTSLKMINKRRQNGKNFVQHRVKPGPDPERQSETYWMTGIEMQIESEKPSKNWIEAGSGNLGKIFLEVLGCKNLPNLDFSPTGQDKTDAYVCVAHEDSIVNTSVISDSLNPLWMPWTQRAFIFNMIYPSSQIAVGVFDHDLICKHDPVGRVVINITNFCPNTSYIIKYDLTALIKGQRQTRASITLRIHVQFENERKALIAGMYPSETSLDLNVEEKQHFRTANYTVSNEQDPRVLRLKTLTSYIDELNSYRAISMIALLRWFRHMLLWRGHSPVNIRIPRFSWRSGISPLDRISRPVTLLLPVRSMFAFAWGIAISRNFELIPSFAVWALGWFMVVSATVGRDHPNPWNRPRTFGELLHVLVFGRTPRRPPIVSNQNQAEIQNYQEEEQRKKEVYERILDNLRKEEERLLGTDVFDDADVAGGDLDLDIGAKAAAALAQMTLLSPFSSTLLPLQMRLHEVCVNFRKAKSVFLWRDSYISFWIVIACGAGSLILAFVPWAFILKWTFTVSVWVFLGPWMKLVDIFFIRPRQTEEQGQEDLTKKFKNKYKRMLGLSIQNKLKREADIKERDIRRYMFGKHHMRVPVFKEELYYDDPLGESAAKPCTAEEIRALQSAARVEKKYGQRLHGDMIPKRG